MSDEHDAVIDVLTKLIVQHERVINSLASAFADSTQILLKEIRACSECKCPATVEHSGFSMRALCDRCAAIDIVKNHSIELDWVDLELSEQVRKLCDFTALLTSPAVKGPTFH